MKVRFTDLVCGILMGLSGFVPANAQPQKISRVLPLCEAASALDAGCFAAVDFDAAAADSRLGDKNLIYWIDGRLCA